MDSLGRLFSAIAIFQMLSYMTVVPLDGRYEVCCTQYLPMHLYLVMFFHIKIEPIIPRLETKPGCSASVQVHLPKYGIFATPHYPPHVQVRTFRVLWSYGPQFRWKACGRTTWCTSYSYPEPMDTATSVIRVVFIRLYLGLGWPHHCSTLSLYKKNTLQCNVADWTVITCFQDPVTKNGYYYQELWVQHMWQASRIVYRHGCLNPNTKGKVYVVTHLSKVELYCSFVVLGRITDV